MEQIGNAGIERAAHNVMDIRFCRKKGDSLVHFGDIASEEIPRRGGHLPPNVKKRRI
jgi:hypothetical protein